MAGTFAGSDLMKGESGGMPSSSGWGSYTSGQKAGLAGMGAAAILPMLMGGGSNDTLSSAMSGMKKNVEETTDLSKALGVEGQDMFRSVLPYLKDILSNNQQSVMLATMPQRRKVMDQYDAARKSIAEFSPRSGGTAAGMNEMRANESSDLATIAGEARSNAFGTGANMAGSLQGLGLNAAGQAMSGQNALANLGIQEQQMSQQSAAGYGQALGMIAALAFL